VSLGQLRGGKSTRDIHAIVVAAQHRSAPRKKYCTTLCVSIEPGKQARNMRHVSSPFRQGSVSSTRTPSIAGRKGVVR
jgi:hypothetical protein